MTPKELREHSINKMAEDFVTDMKEMGVPSYVIGYAFDSNMEGGQAITRIEGNPIALATMIENLAASLPASIFVQLCAQLAFSPKYIAQRGEDVPEPEPIDIKKVN